MNLPPSPPPWLGIGGVLTALLALLGALAAWQRRFSAHPELTRKCAHVGMGLVTLLFPWLFERVWPVWVLCAGSVTILALVRWWRPLRPSLGRVMGRVERRGGGEFYFALSVATVFWLAHGAPTHGGINLSFVIPMLILTFADTAGALVGVRYGRSRYAAGDGHKSVEGSLAFFLAAFCSTYVPLLLWTSLGRAESLLISLLAGLLVTLLEAGCGYGLDNFCVPLASFVALRLYPQLGASALTLRLAILAGLTVCLLVWRRTSPDDGPTGHARWRRQGTLALAASLIGLTMVAV